MTEPANSKSSIMIVDDETEYIEFLKDILNPFGFQLMIAQDGSQALERLDQALPDIILLDVLMPGMDGFEICRRIKADDRTKSIPVILMTALSEDVNRVTGLELGAVDYITKPFRKQEVLARIKTHFVMRRLQEQLKQTRQDMDSQVALRTKEIRTSYEQLKKELAERKRMERILKQAQKMESISTLSRGVAHDFNNILSIIIGYCEVAAMEELPEGSPVGSCLREINAAAFRARELVQRLLTFCLETEQKKKHTKITPIITAALDRFEAGLPEAVETETRLEEETGMVLADADQIRQLIEILCQNAVQAMTDTGGRMEIGLSQIYLDPDHVTAYPNLVSGHFSRILVRDTGPGMDPETIERIFDPYFTTREPGEGTGMGLAVAHGIVVGHGGAILADSKPGSGSSFEVLLPCEMTERVRPDVKDTKPLPTGSGTVLFVDDEKSLIHFGKVVLERQGYTVEGYASSPEALAAFKTAPEKFDFVITDHIMPKMQGMELAKKIRSIRSDIPVMLCTGSKSDELVEQARAAGIVDVIQKPIPMKSLIETIKQILAKR